MSLAKEVTNALEENFEPLEEYKVEYANKWKNTRAKFSPGDKVILHPYLTSGMDTNREMPKRLTGKGHEHATVIEKSKATGGGYGGPSGYTTRYHIKYDDGTTAKIHSLHLLPAHLSHGIQAAKAKGFEYTHRSGKGKGDVAGHQDIHFKHPKTGARLTVHYEK